MKKIRPIAIHLPQFHPFKENDEWWGKGFTEWTNVTKAKPQFEGHYQPHLPADLGFYDLRLEEARLAQEALAKEYGIYGFCYYHYWFNGKRLMHEPIDRKLNNSKEDLPFMLCWANENWSRTWDGKDKEMLIEQNYSLEDDRAHILHLLKYFQDERYIRINNKPVFAVYRSSELPNPAETLRIWREEAYKVGLELYICRMDRWNTPNGQDILDLGFDAAIDFQPLSPNLNKFRKEEYQNFKSKMSNRSIVERILNRSKYEFNKIFYPKKNIKTPQNHIDLERYVEYDLQHLSVEYKRFPCVTPGWDNSARRKKDATVFINSSPDLFKKWVSGKKNNFEHFKDLDENLLFINAWNEWAEGNHLEPDQKYGTKFLQALKDGLK
ncbi:glycoside hydrolase family 99-like domain-containing protein [Faecalibacter sp. LW9]|uniref:glycosyltransferase WbsX family protein n=1 Tax=Faecalibacter sp. LW9 TaxID=3103144 RepID=UPI002AFF50A1|nr:glycoside hydrolase family 99-like domain-containing protein [Faecalibacter sp. LW9]